MGITTTRVQVLSEGHWLYRYDKTSDLYTISDEVNLGVEDTEWDECTNEQKIKFEEHNKQVENSQE
jgi:hypothetical protein